MKTRLLLLIFLASMSIFAQCPPSGPITLTTQAEVNNFIAQYPNCTTFDGNFFLVGDSINNISGLSSLTTINGGLTIQNTSLTNLAGLNNLNTVQRITLSTNAFLTDISQLSGINVALIGNISITLNNALISLNGLQNITAFARMTISNNPALSSLTGLEGLSTSTSPFNTAVYIESNAGLTSLNGLQNLVNFSNSGGIIISANPSLIDISAISNASAFGTLEIVDNTLLSDCAIFSICNKLNVSPADVIINGNATGCESVTVVQAACNPDPCPPSNVTFTTQAQVDAFVAQYPNCTEINGLLTINGGNINNLSGLSNIISITNGLTISQCNTLASLNGLQNITSINGNISISNNPLLVDLTGLNGLISLNNNSSGSLGNIFLNQNNSLTSLNGLQNLTTLTKENLMNTITGFAIFNCNNLTDISALGNINNAVVEYIVLSNNTSLNNCAIETVCNKLAVDTSWVTISGNATGCESIAVVETACDTLSLSDFELESNLKIYPNPFNSQITFDFGNSYENVTVLIHDITGKQLYKNSFSGNQLVVNNLGNLPSGIYVANLTTENGASTTKKIVK